jgi:hypothetical protein
LELAFALGIRKLGAILLKLALDLLRIGKLALFRLPFGCQVG